MRNTLVLSLMTLIATCSVASASAYTFTTIDIPGGNNTIAYGINDTGQIVANGLVGSDPHAFLLTPISGATVPAAPGARAAAECPGGR